jgi:hypothetical protein
VATEISVIGELIIWDSEGGFGPDEILIGGEGISGIIGRLFGLDLNGRGSLGNRELGPVRLTIERLEK